MALTFKIGSDKVPPPRLVSAGEVQAAAGEQGNPFANRAIAITKPKIHFETKQLSFETKGAEFRFKTGTLPLTLRQEILISDALSECARNIWLSHEQDHVADNEAVMKSIEAELRKDAEFAEILLFPKWTPLGKNNENFTKAQKKIGQRVGEIFKALTSAAATSRDTDAEYKRVEEKIKKDCKP